MSISRQQQKRNGSENLAKIKSSEKRRMAWRQSVTA